MGGRGAGVQGEQRTIGLECGLETNSEDWACASEDEAAVRTLGGGCTPQYRDALALVYTYVVVQPRMGGS